MADWIFSQKGRKVVFRKETYLLQQAVMSQTETLCYGTKNLIRLLINRSGFLPSSGFVIFSQSAIEFSNSISFHQLKHQTHYLHYHPISDWSILPPCPYFDFFLVRNNRHK